MPHDPFDALTDLFLGDLSPMHADAPREPSPVARPRKPETQAVHAGPAPAEAAAPMIEAVMSGHLPAMGGAWVAQYARTRAEELGRPVVLVRAGNGHLRIEMHEPCGAPARATIRTNYPAGAMVQGAREAGLVLFEVTSGAVAQPLRPSRVTLLTSGDEAGLVHAYRCLKDLAALTRLEPPARLGVVVAGAAGSTADTARRRLVEASENFIGVSLENSANLPRLESGRPATTLFEGAFEGDVSGLLPAMSEAAAATAAPVARPMAEAAPSVSARSTVPVDGLGTAANRHSLQGVPAHHELVDRPSAPLPPASKVTEPQPVLVDFIPGLAAMDVRCPAAPEIEIALDSSGMVHVLGRGEKSLAGLLAAAAWCEANAGLLARLSPAGSRGGAAVRHLFTDDRDCLRTLHATGVRLHAMARAEVVVRCGWAAIPVN